MNISSYQIILNYQSKETIFNNKKTIESRLCSRNNNSIGLTYVDLTGRYVGHNCQEYKLLLRC